MSFSESVYRENARLQGAMASAPHAKRQSSNKAEIKATTERLQKCAVGANGAGASAREAAAKQKAPLQADMLNTIVREHMAELIAQLPDENKILGCAYSACACVCV